MIKKVLIVDDNSANLYMLETMLKGYGLEVTSAVNGRDALDKARLNPPDLIVTDILMPVMDGYALCRQWKSDDKLKHIPLIFYTATYTGPKDEKFALSLGADGFIIKPQEPDIFMDMLKEVLGEKYTARQVVNKPLGEEMEFFRQHNETLFRKLEKKMSELETSNQKLRDSEEKYRNILEDMDDVYFEVDIKGNIKFVNPSSCKMSGYSEEELLGMSFKKISAPDGIEMVIQYFGEIFRTGKTGKPFLWNLMKKNGERGFFEIVVSLIRDKQGKSTGFRGIGRDITERKKTEKDLQNSEELFRNLFQHHAAVKLIIDPDTGNIMDANEAAVNYYGWPREQITQMKIQDINASSEEEVKEAMEKVRVNKKIRFEFRHRKADGSVRDVEVFSSIIKAQGKDILHSIVHDITDRKYAQEALRESEDKFRSIFENSSSAMAIIERDTTISMVNKEYCRISLYDEKDVIGMSWTKQIPPEDLKRLEEYNRERRINPKLVPSNYEFSFYRKDGEIRNALISIAILPKVKEVVASFVDITERKQAEKKLQQTLNSLEKAVGTTIQVLVSAVEFRDPYTAGHQLRVADLARTIATEMGLAPDKIEGIRMAGSIHDIGKLSIPAEILSKPTKLTNIEFSLIKEHPRIGYEMLKDVESPWPLAQIVHQHHERIDGSGYPGKLKGD